MRKRSNRIEFGMGSSQNDSKDDDDGGNRIDHCQDAQIDGNTISRSTIGFIGTDSDGYHYSSVEEMWEIQVVIPSTDSSSSWYERAASYYQDHCPSTIDGVLGGFASITEMDLQGSLEFVQELSFRHPKIKEWAVTNVSSQDEGESTARTIPKRRACECGAGIGRVTKGLLLNLSGIGHCDLVESSATLIDAAPEYLGNSAAARCRFFCTGLQDWIPTPRVYSVVWIQWVLSYLTDDDIVLFLQRCGTSLTEDGVIILKENTCTDVDFEVDNEDASVTRSVRYWKYLISKAGLRILHEKMQDGLPDEIYPVPMFALDVRP